jgi:hypothetical protein
MQQFLEQRLCQAFPEIFADSGKSPQESNMAFGCDFGDGWYDILEELCQQLQAIREASGIITRATQIKEKYGTLRFSYVHAYDPKLVQMFNTRVWISNLAHCLQGVSWLLYNKVPRLSRFAMPAFHGLLRFLRRREHVYYRRDGNNLTWKRWYPEQYYDRVEKLVDEVEEESAYVCEACGKYPAACEYRYGYKQALCVDCEADMLERMKSGGIAADTSEGKQEELKE